MFLEVSDYFAEGNSTRIVTQYFCSSNIRDILSANINIRVHGNNFIWRIYMTYPHLLYTYSVKIKFETRCLCNKDSSSGKYDRLTIVLKFGSVRI